MEMGNVGVGLGERLNLGIYRQYLKDSIGMYLRMMR